MNKEELTYKWLNHELNADELEAFKQLEDYEALRRLDKHLSAFKAPQYETSQEVHTILKSIKFSKKPKRLLSALGKIAAVFVVCFGVYYYTTTLDTTIKTLASQKQTIELPDDSKVMLNALSTVSYNKSKWDEKRDISLQGEAYFKVSKGSSFQVLTEIGKVTVLGTQFNVKQRDNYFEVFCYEGLVKVKYKDIETKLFPGNRFLMIDGKLIATEKEAIEAPSWIDNYSSFKSMPYNQVIAEFERQYDITIELKSVDTSQLFTGSFTHDNMEVALKSITLPLHLNYNQTGNTITLKRE